MSTVDESAIAAFRKGQTVTLSAEGIASNIRLGKHGRGVVVGFGHGDALVRVVADGQKASSVKTMHMDFLVPLP